MRKILFFILFMFFCTFIRAENKIIISGHPDYPPFMSRDGETLDGVGVKLAKSIFDELGLEYEVMYVGPWKRVQESARNGTIDFIVGLYSNNERLSYMDYTESYMTDPTSIFVMKGKTFDFNGRDDLIGKRGVTMHGDSFGEELDRFIESKLRINKAIDAKLILDRLAQGWADYALWGYYPFMINAAKFDLHNDVEVLEKRIVEENMYMAFSKKSKYRHLVPKLNLIIQRLKDDGSISRWVQEYLESYHD